MSWSYQINISYGTVTVVEIIKLRDKCDDSILVSMLKFLNLANKSADLNT